MLHKPELKSIRLYDFELDVNFLEDMWVKIISPDCSVYVCVVYITSMKENSHLYFAFFDKLRENIVKLEASDRVFVFGDFNLSEIEWNLNDQGYLMPSGGKSAGKALDLINTLQFCNFNQYNNVLNHRGDILDLVLSSDSKSVVKAERSDMFLVNEDDYHPSLAVTIEASLEYMKINDSYKRFNFTKADYSVIREKLSDVDWGFVNDLPLERSVPKFYSILNEIIDKNVPRYKPKGKYPFWYSRELIRLLKVKDRLRRKWKRTETNEHYMEFSLVRAKCKTMIVSCHKQYIRKLQKNMKKNVKLFWAYTKSRKQTNTYPVEFKRSTKD